MGINKNFVVRNGLEVATNLLYANDEENRVGINTAVPEYNLDVQGDSKLEGKIVSAGDTSGLSGQYIKSTGDGWEWESFPRSRISERYTLVATQTRVPASGQFGTFSLVEQELTSIYLDGVKLTVGDYSIDAGGGSITLFAAAFGDEEIEIIAHGATSVGTGNTGILGVTARKAGIASGDAGRITIFDFVGLGVTLDGRSGLCTVHIDSGGLTDVSGDPTPTLGGNLDLDSNDITGIGNVNITGVITATSFSGIGSNITGISTLNITNYGVGLGEGSSGPSGVFGLLNDDAAVGIFTDTAAVGLGTTDPRFLVEIGDRQSEIVGLGTNLWVNGNARITGILTVGSSSIAIDGVNDEIRIGAGFTLTADTITQTANLQITGIVTATGFDGDLVGQHKVFTAGVSNSDDYDVALFLDPTQGGHTFNRYDLGGKLQYNPSTGQLSNVGIISATGQIISGVTTHQGEVNFQSNINLSDNDVINIGSGNDLQISHTGTVSKIEESGDGGLELKANPSVTIGQYGTTEEMASFRVGAGVSLFYDNLKKFEIISAGATVTGTLYATSFNGPLTGDVTGDVTGDSTGLSGSPNIVVNDAQVSGALTVTGISSAASFSGSGIGLTGMVDVTDGTYGGATVSPQITVADGRITGITATLISGGGGGSGTEVIIEDNDSLVGTAGTINFGSGLSVSSATLGVVTVTAASAEVVNDTTPQLGGNLDLNSRTINGTGNINITGSSRFNGPATCTSSLTVNGITFESGDLDLSIGSGNITLGSNAIYAGGTQYRFYASGDDSVLFHDNTDGSLVAVTNTNFIVSNVGFAQTSAVFTPTGAAELYYNDLKKFETTDAGVSVTGALNVSGISSATAESGSFTATAGVAYTANTYSVSSFANAEYTLFFQHSSGIQSQKVLVMDDGTTAYSQEYGIMYSDDLLVSVGATVKSGNVELQWTPETGVSGIVTFKYSRDMLI